MTHQDVRGIDTEPRPATEMESVLTRSQTVAIEDIEVGAYTVPTEQPESDGTHEWDSTTLVVVHAHAEGQTGMGYTYTHEAAARVIRSTLSPLVLGHDLMSAPRIWLAMNRALRNDGARGIGAAAISAVDNALWDLRARLMGIPLVWLLGSAHEAVPIYGSGGFTSLDEVKLRRQLEGWASEGITRVKIKVGREPETDVQRVEWVRRVIGDDVELMVDANGAYSRKQALRMAVDFASLGVTWFEEPVSSDDLRSLRLIQQRGPTGMEIAAGEYGYDLSYFRRMIQAGAVDVIQPDVTRCMGITGFLAVAALAEAAGVPVSAHTAPAQSLHACCAVRPLRHIEWFHDHVRIEQMLFEGAPRPERAGMVRPDLSRPGNGLVLRHADAERYRAR